MNTSASGAILPRSIRRRAALWLMGNAMVAAMAAGSTAACAKAASPAPSAQELVYIGMHGSQITAARFDTARGTLTMIGPVAAVPRPTWQVAHPTRPILYSGNEAGNEGNANGTIISFAVNRASGALTKLGEADAGGGGTTNLFLDAPSMTMLAANYGGGSVATLPIGADGAVGTRVSLNAATGSGPNPRQKSAHAHGVVVDPAGHFALVSDLGADRVFVYPFDRKTHTLGSDDPAHSRHYAVPAGSGPRHMAFDPRGRFLYMVNELTAEILSFSWNAQQGRLALVQAQSTSSAGFTGVPSAAEVAVSRDGRFVYASNRGEHTIVAYRVDQRSGRLNLVQRIGSGGELPWSFAIHGSGRWLIAADEGSDRLAVFRIDPATGRLTDTQQRLTTTKPVSVTFVR